MSGRKREEKRESACDAFMRVWVFLWQKNVWRDTFVRAARRTEEEEVERVGVTESESSDCKGGRSKQLQL